MKRLSIFTIAALAVALFIFDSRSHSGQRRIYLWRGRFDPATIRLTSLPPLGVSVSL